MGAFQRLIVSGDEITFSTDIFVFHLQSWTIHARDGPVDAEILHPVNVGRNFYGGFRRMGQVSRFTGAPLRSGGIHCAGSPLRNHPTVPTNLQVEIRLAKNISWNNGSLTVHKSSFRFKITIFYLFLSAYQMISPLESAPLGLGENLFCPLAQYLICRRHFTALPPHTQIALQ